jgi:RNA polymerase sigma factor (sigma-70 family)
MRKGKVWEECVDRSSELWGRFCQGDSEAFADLYQAYARPLFSYGYRISDNENLVEDAIQDLFVELWKSKQNLDKAVNVKSYLFKSLRYKLIRLGKFSTVFTSDELMDRLMNNEQSVESVISEKEEHKERTTQVRMALETLSARQQEAISLKFYHGFSNEEIASIMAVNYQSATNILHRAILSLRKHFTCTTTTALLSFFCFPNFF